MSVLRMLLFAALLLSSLAPAKAQNPAHSQTGEPAASPIALVSRAESLFRTGDQEDATALLWQALDILRGKASNSVEQATELSARFLLKEHDKFEMERRAAFTAVATLQTEVAKSYRIKKWYDTAQDRLDVAAQFDPDVTVKERTAVAAKQPKAVSTAAPAPQPKNESQVSPHLRQAGVEFRSGPWQETAEGLYIKDPGPKPSLSEWTCKAQHEDHEIVVDIRPDDAKANWNAAIGVGLNILPGSTHYSGYRCYVQHYDSIEIFKVFVWQIVNTQPTKLIEQDVKCQQPTSGYHRFAVRVMQGKLELQVNGEPAVTIAVRDSIRGRIGLLHGLLDTNSCGLNFRGLRIDPLPADAPSDEELRAKSHEATQHEITASVAAANELLNDKQVEAAAQRLRDALGLLQDLPKGILRTNLGTSIEGMLNKADKLSKKREQASKECAKVLGELADKYVLDGRPRLARLLTRQALGFDPDGQSTRLQTIDEAVAAWNVAQATARASELGPPSDDGKVLREWFEGGRLLDSRGMTWTVAGPSARVDNMSDASTMLMPKQGVLLAGSFGVHMRLPLPGCQAGVCFDAAGPHDFCVALVMRRKADLLLVVSRWAGGKWIILGQKPIKIDPWRQEAWHAITVELDAAGVKVKVLETVIQIARKQLGDANGRIGLYAANTGEPPATLELRGFHVQPK